MAAKIDALRKPSLMAFLLLISSGAGHYDDMQVLQRQARLDSEPQLEPARANAANRAAQERLLAQQPQQVPPQPAENAAAEVGYQACRSRASATHDASWAAECKHLAEKTEQDRADCLAKLKLPKIYCDASYPLRDAAADCTLPDKVASVLDAALAQARYRCVREREAAEQ